MSSELHPAPQFPPSLWFHLDSRDTECDLIWKNSHCIHVKRRSYWNRVGPHAMWLVAYETDTGGDCPLQGEQELHLRMANDQKLKTHDTDISVSRRPVVSYWLIGSIRTFHLVIQAEVPGDKSPHLPSILTFSWHMISCLSMSIMGTFMSKTWII